MAKAKGRGGGAAGPLDGLRSDKRDIRALSGAEGGGGNVCSSKDAGKKGSPLSPNSKKAPGTAARNAGAMCDHLSPGMDTRDKDFKI